MRKNPKNDSFLRFFKSDLGSARTHTSCGIAGGMSASRTRELARKIPTILAPSLAILALLENKRRCNFSASSYAILTNIIHQEWSDLSVQDHKDLKGLTSQNLRDHMSEAELIFTALAEL